VAFLSAQDLKVAFLNHWFRKVAFLNSVDRRARSGRGVGGRI
jgi:hypothetical protein